MTTSVGCIKCRLPRCACSYIKELMEGKHGKKTLEVALEQMKVEKPHRAGCPCPPCWSQRTKAWDEWAQGYGKF